MKKLLSILGLCVAVVPLLGLFFVIWFALPPWVGWVVLGLFAAGFVWWRTRRNSSVLPGSEASLSGRQSTKGGLL